MIANGRQARAGRTGDRSDVPLAGRRADGALPRVLRRRPLRGRAGHPRRPAVAGRGVAAAGPPTSAGCRCGCCEDARGIVAWLARPARAPTRSARPAAWSPASRPGFALENQTRPTYPALGRRRHGFMVARARAPVVRRLGRGARWRDIWLNEGFATFMQLRYDETHGGRTPSSGSERPGENIARRALLGPADRRPRGASEIFAPQVYTRGAMTLQALRHRVGETAFWTILRTWAADRAGGNGSTEEFEALAEQRPGRTSAGSSRPGCSPATGPRTPPRTGSERLGINRRIEPGQPPRPGRLPSLRRRPWAASGRPSRGAAPSRPSGR